MPEEISTNATQPGTSAPAIGGAVRKERRVEPRIAADSIRAMIRLDSLVMQAEILDISTSGVRLRVGSVLAVDREVTLSFDHTVAVGNIRYCRAEEDRGPFQIGLQLEEVLTRA